MHRTVVQNYIYRNRTFLIIESDEMFNDERAKAYRFFGIEHTDIDGDGKLKRSMNIAEMNGEKTFKDCLERIHNRCDLDYYIESGMTRLEATAKLFNLDLTKLQEAFPDHN